jgi:hypothetical protein
MITKTNLAFGTLKGISGFIDPGCVQASVALLVGGALDSVPGLGDPVCVASAFLAIGFETAPSTPEHVLE